MYLFLLFLFGTKLLLTHCQSDCTKLTTCGECIGYAKEGCFWCPADIYTGKRCQPVITLKNNTLCVGQKYQSELKIDVPEIYFNEGAHGKDVVQFIPHFANIKARPGVPVAINMSYKPAEDYPLDIYYLVDYSITMLTQVDVLRAQGKTIYEGLLNLTNNVRFGIGSFIEKPSMPFVDINNQKSYSFKNHLSLTNKTDEFANALEEKPSGENYDHPEAGFDALMQVMVCNKEIGWRENARRIIVLCTDSSYHSAGDGKFVGAFLPNDMKCHMSNNSYTLELKLDYPSVSQINKVATEKNFMIIFAAASDVQNHYKVLEKEIRGVKYVPLEKSPKLLEIIQAEYTGLIRNVVLEHNFPNFITLSLNPDCSKPDKCVLQYDKPIKIGLTLVIDSCPQNNIFNYTLRIGPYLLEEHLTITVEVDCQCDCEKPGTGDHNSLKCSSSGTYQCGVCNCNDDRYGDVCQCTGTSLDMRDSNKCKESNDTVSLCNGHGACHCGKCTCDEDFSGQFCEYDAKACITADGKKCSGNGECVFGKCKCSPQWLPDFCACPDNNLSCIAPQSNEVCSGNGKCECGKCVCAAKGTNGICTGMFCDECDEVAKRCKELEDYAYCNFEQSIDDCSLKYNLTNAEVVLVSKTQINSDEYFEAKMWCSKIVEDDKKFIFKYYYPNLSILRIIIQNELESPPAANILIAACSVVGAVLLIGIVTVIVWKVLVDMHDKKEYDKFAKESDMAGFDIAENPHYEPPSMTFVNPTYNS